MELTPLEAFEKLQMLSRRNANTSDLLYIIETALKEKEQQDILINVIKNVIEFGLYDTKVEETEEGLSISQRIGIRARREIDKKEKELYRWFILNQCFPKELKTLEIIKEKRVDFDLLTFAFKRYKDKTLDYYNYCMPLKHLTQEEYDLLREVLL